MKIHGYPTGALGLLLGLLVAAVFVFAAVGVVIARLWRLRLWIGAVLGIVLALMVIATLAFAQSGQHGAGHAEHHDWYQKLQRPNGAGSCCSKLTPEGDGDCRPVRAYLHDDGQWRAVVGGSLVRIPPSTILEGTAPDGNAHLCMSKAFTVYCFSVPQPKS